MAEEEAKKEESSEITKKLRENPWIVSTIVLGLFALVLLFFMFKGGLTGNVISEADIGTNAVDFINTQILAGQGTVTLNSVSEKYGMYEVLVNYKGQPVPAYFTKDGQYFVGTQIVSLTGNAVADTSNTQTPTEVPKSDKPVVGAFIFSYCPYGLQFEKALFPVYDLLKNKADINIIAIGAMHGEFEKIESLRQISIEQLYGKDRLIAYLEEFDASTDIGSCSGDSACLDRYIPIVYTKLGINQANVENYIENSAESIYNQQGQQAASLGVSGSPTLVINGVEVSVARNADAIKTAICDAFNTAPAECSQSLPTTSPGPGFGSSSGSSSAASCG